MGIEDDENRVQGDEVDLFRSFGSGNQETINKPKNRTVGRNDVEDDC